MVNDNGDSVPWSSIAVRLIPAMNDEFMRLLGDYRPINPDNRGSHRAGHELEQAGVDPEWCEQKLRQLCRVFNPSKHGGGKPPRTLAYYAKTLIREWKLWESQYSLPLARVEPSHPEPAPPAHAPVESAAAVLPDPAPATDPTRWRREMTLERSSLTRIDASVVRRAIGG